MTKKEAVIKYFAAMDTGMLELLLNDDKTYQRATKEIFLEKITESFEKFKTAGDTHLIPHAGECESESCNYRCKGFSFVGNSSGKLLDLIFEEEQDDYKDIYYCHHFISDIASAKYSDKIFISVGEDESAIFKPSIEYSILLQQCNLAYEQIMKYKDNVLEKEVYIRWLNQNKGLTKKVERLGFRIEKFNRFSFIQRELQELIETLEYEKKSEKALVEYDNLTNYTEYYIMPWLVKYEKLDCVPLFMLNNEAEYYTNFALIGSDKNLLIDLADFKHLIRFRDIYHEAYHPLFKKYNTIDKKQWPAGKAYPDNYHYLSYHLKKRGMAFSPPC